MGDDLRVITDPPGLNFVLSFGGTGCANPKPAEHLIQACDPKELHLTLAANVRRSSAEFAWVRPSSPVLRRELVNGSPENSFAGGNPSTSNKRSPRTGPPRTTFAGGELQFAKKHILDGVNDRSPQTVVRQRRTSSFVGMKF